MRQQLLLPLVPPHPAPSASDGPDLASYDHVILAFSGGKDCMAALLHLLDRGVRPELWHHEVDGREGSRLMDWPVTQDYCRQVAAAFGLSIYFSWREGGFEREMLRDGQPTARSWFETPEGLRSAGGEGRPRRETDGSLRHGTRRKFPQVAADLSVRWCSAYCKIDVGARAITNQPRFLGVRTLFVSGERAEESAARARYKAFEPHRTDNRAGRKARRHVDHWRPVHSWTEAEVWDIIKRHRVNPHPAYRLGWARLSCAACIFGSPNQWASLKAINPCQFRPIARYEAEFGVTIHRTETIVERAARGTPYRMDPADVQAALATRFTEPVILDQWVLPAGAFGENAGPC